MTSLFLWSRLTYTIHHSDETQEAAVVTNPERITLPTIPPCFSSLKSFSCLCADTHGYRHCVKFFIHPTHFFFFKVISHEHVKGISLNLAQTRWTDQIFVNSGQGHCDLLATFFCHDSKANYDKINWDDLNLKGQRSTSLSHHNILQNHFSGHYSTS